MIHFDVNTTENSSDVLKAIIAGLDGKDAIGLNEVGGRSAVVAAIEYHREFDQEGGWRGPRYLGKGPNDGGDFGADVARGWMYRAATIDSATIANNADYYAFKVRGGTITPKRAKYLTIPLIREARGLYASVYSQNTGHRLFTIKGKNALFERTEGQTTGSRGRRGQAGSASIRTSNIRAVYALVRSVTMTPWPNALPPEEVIGQAFVDGYRKALVKLIEKA